MTCQCFYGSIRPPTSPPCVFRFLGVYRPVTCTCVYGVYLRAPRYRGVGWEGSSTGYSYTVSKTTHTQTLIKFELKKIRTSVFVVQKENYKIPCSYVSTDFIFYDM